MNREGGVVQVRLEMGQDVARQALVGQGRRMGSNLKPWGALEDIKQKCGIVQLHEGHSGMCGMDCDLGRHKRAGRDSSQ